MNAETQQLLRYLDREMSAVEAERFRARLAQSPALQRELEQLQRVGALLRVWSGSVEARGGELLESTLQRVQDAARRRARYTTLSCGIAALVLLALHGGDRSPEPIAELGSGSSRLIAGAAIERVEATDQQAQVFVVGRSLTPVVWLVDDAQDDYEPAPRDPG